MRIAPVSQFNYKFSTNKQNSQMNRQQQSFGTIGNYHPIGFDPITYTFGSPTVTCAGLQLRSHEMNSLKTVNDALNTITPEKQREFLINASERYKQDGKKQLYRHVAHRLTESRKTDSDREEFKKIMENALSTQATNEDPKKVAANSAYILEWFRFCLPEYSLEGYEYVQRDLVEQARKELNNPDWHPYVEPFHPEIAGSGAKYE